MKTLNAISLFVLLIISTSCYTTYSTYKGNVHENTIGKTKNEILRSYGIPEKTEDDGAGGSVMVFEKITQTTITNSSTQTLDRSRSNGSVVYGNKGIIQANQNQGGQVSNTDVITQTTTNKDYCYIFLDPENVVYDFKSNYGAQYDYDKCFNKSLTWVSVGVSCLFVYPAIVTVPWAIISYQKAKNKDKICK